MRNIRCPKCEGKLGVPDKVRQKPVRCPHCEHKFHVDEGFTESKSSSAESKKKPSKGKLRTLPVPGTVKSTVPPTSSSDSSTASSESALEPPKSRLKAPTPVPNLGIGDDDLSAPAPKKKRRSSGKKKKKAREIPSPNSAVKTEPTETEVATKPTVVARIIETTSDQPELVKEGQLPTLQLNDDSEPAEKEEPMTRNPMVLGLLVCGSILLSTVLLIFAQPAAEVKSSEVERARSEIVEFYQVKREEELKPYQQELRKAQLAHSRADYPAEIYFYQQVMARFVSEDRDEAVGVTGSPGDDIALHGLVSTLLNEAKRLSKRGGR